MKIALFRGNGVFSKLIQWQTRSVYSHAAIIDDFGGLWESREGIGVRWLKDFQEELGSCQVDVFEVETTYEQAALILSFLESQLNKKYDWLMVLRFVSRRQASRTESGKWFCSEIAFAAFQKAGINLLERIEPWAVSPGILSISPKLKFLKTYEPTEN